MMKIKPKLALIDGDHIAWIASAYKIKRDEDNIALYDENGNTIKEYKSLEEALKLCDEFFISILNSVATDLYIGAISNRSFRYKIYPDYKKQRQKAEKPQYLSEILTYLKEKYNFVSLENFEADDIVGALKNYYKEDYNIVVVSSDKDVLMLEGENFNSKKREFTTVSEDDAFTFFWKSMITGDSADNIKGIPRLGEVKANTFLTSVSKKNTIKEILSLYITHFGESKGIEEFYSNYKCLKIIDNIEDLGLDQTSVPIVCKFYGQVEV